MHPFPGMPFSVAGELWQVALTHFPMPDPLRLAFQPYIPLCMILKPKRELPQFDHSSACGSKTGRSTE